MVAPLGKTQLMEKETGKHNNTGATTGTSSEDLAVPETIPLWDSSFNYPSRISE